MYKIREDPPICTQDPGPPEDTGLNTSAAGAVVEVAALLLLLLPGILYGRQYHI